MEDDYRYNMLQAIKAAESDSDIETLIDKIYADGFNDGIVEG